MDYPQAAPVNTAQPGSDTDGCPSNVAVVVHGDADSEEPLEHFQADSAASFKYQASSYRTSDSLPVDDSDRNDAPDDSPGRGQVSLPGVADSEEHAKPSDPIDAGSRSPSNCRGAVDNDERNDPPDWMHPNAQVESPAAWATPTERASTT